MSQCTMMRPFLIAVMTYKLLNPLVTNGLSHTYQMDKYTFIFRGFGVDYSYTQYIKKRNAYIFVDNLSNVEDVYFKLSGYID